MPLHTMMKSSNRILSCSELPTPSRVPFWFDRTKLYGNRNGSMAGSLKVEVTSSLTKWEA